MLLGALAIIIMLTVGLVVLWSQRRAGTVRAVIAPPRGTGVARATDRSARPER